MRDYREEIVSIFKQREEDLLDGLQPSNRPVAVLFGGQAACGKSALIEETNKMFPNRSFLNINGDQYRVVHPSYREFIHNISSFSQNTQICSNVFTECLIDSALSRHYNVTVEGTLRAEQTTQQTITKFKNSGYNVCVMVIAAPFQLTELGAFVRFAKELERKGFGRLVDFNSARNAYLKMPDTVDSLYLRKAVDSIHIYSRFANDHVAHYNLGDEGWDNTLLPSNIIEEERKKLLRNKDEIRASLMVAKEMSEVLPEEVLEAFWEKYHTVEKLLLRTNNI